MLGKAHFFFNQQNASKGVTAAESSPGRQPNNSSANYCEIIHRMPFKASAREQGWILNSNGDNLCRQAHFFEIRFDLWLVDRVHGNGQFRFVPLEKGRRDNLLPDAGHVFAFPEGVDVDHVFNFRNRVYAG
jgi:hypothetical protein